MKMWWQGLSDRERILLGVAGFITSLVAFWFLVWTPILSGRAEAKTKLDMASRTVAQLQEAYWAQRLSQPHSGAAAQMNDQTVAPAQFRSAVTRAATNTGLSIARVQNGEDDRVGLLFERADPRLVFFWLERVETQIGGRITRFTMEQAGGNLVRVSVDLEPGA